MHLRYLMLSPKVPDDHPQHVMRSLGITYRRAVPQSLGDQWWFYDCENVPQSLPEFLEVMPEDHERRFA